MNKSEKKLEIDALLTKIKSKLFEIIDNSTKEITPFEIISVMAKHTRLDSTPVCPVVQGYGTVNVDQVMFEVEDNIALPLFSATRSDDDYED